MYSRSQVTETLSKYRDAIKAYAAACERYKDIPSCTSRLSFVPRATTGIHVIEGWTINREKMLADLKEKQAAAEGLQTEVASMLRLAPKDQLEILIDRYHKGMSWGCIAEKRNCPRSSAVSLHDKAITAIIKNTKEI